LPVAPGGRAALDILPLHGLPLYNEDDDAEHAPEPVRALRSAIAASDGVIMISGRPPLPVSSGIYAARN
jgi:chromate reductase, NAD(P)H dehydrogenase (quinone)